MKKIKTKCYKVSIGNKAYRMFLRISLHLKKESKREVIEYLIESIKVKKNQEEFASFLKEFPDFPECLEKTNRRFGSISFKEDQNIFLEYNMRDFCFWNKIRFFQYIVYFHYKNSFVDFEQVLSGEKLLRLIPEDVVFKKNGSCYRRKT